MVYKYLIQDLVGNLEIDDIDNLWTYSLVAKDNDVRNMVWKLWSCDRKHAFYFLEYESSEFYKKCEELNLTIIDEIEYGGE